jgi:SOS-response transcriptional repressor LexA
MAIGPTEKQLKLLKFIKRTVKNRGVSPTVREMQINAHLKSTAAIFSMLRRMQDRKLVKIHTGKARGVELL